jgi:UDP-N-acetylmuramate--alanine ligase
VVRAKELGIPIVHRAEMLRRLMERQKGIAIAGAHGKTTTSSMISLMFERNNLDPTIVVGGELTGIGGNAKLGAGEYIVAEADESDGSFLKLLPFITVVTNVEDDHLDHYGTREKIKEAFVEFISKTPADGFAVLCGDDPGVAQIMPQLEGKVRVITYGLSDSNNYVAKNIKLEGLHITLTLEKDGKHIGDLCLNVPGKHNVKNALAAMTVGIECGLPFEGIAKSLSEFPGVHRRFQKTGEYNGINVFDDYAHHPSELKATLAAARTLNPGRVVAIFQPHRYSRTQLLKEEFGTAFENADVLVLTEIYPAGEKPIPGVSAQLILEEIQKQTGKDVKYIPDRNEIAKEMVEILKPGDLVLTLGAGNIWASGVKLIEMLAEADNV